MDDSFAFRTTVPLRRRFDPTLVKAAVFGALIVLGIGLFASWVVASERASFARTDHRVAPSEVTIAGTMPGRILLPWTRMPRRQRGSHWRPRKLRSSSMGASSTLGRHS
jgi:hypothetical protein